MYFNFSKILLLSLSLLYVQTGHAIHYTDSEVSSPAVSKLSDLPDNPFTLLEKWHQEALSKIGPVETNLGSLATSTKEGIPTSRMMVIKKITKDGIIVCGDARSRKMTDLKNNPYASLTIYWHALQRQIRLRGKAYLLSQSETEEIFKSRSRGSKISSWASDQGEQLNDRTELLNKHEEYNKKYKDKEVPMPEHFACYIIKPNAMNFWMAGPSNLHSVVLYEKVKGKEEWKKSLRSP